VVILYCSGISVPSTSAILLNGLIVNDYFSVPNIDGVYWTLPEELKFYACVFLMILVGQIYSYKL
jgi:hypothetical protein